MAEKKATLKDVFEELLGLMRQGINQLDSIGISKDVAANLTEKLLSTAGYAVNSANFQGMPPGVASHAESEAGGGHQERSDKAHPSSKASVIRQFKSDAARLGITGEDMEEHFGQPPQRSPQETDEENPEKRFVSNTDKTPPEPNPLVTAGANGETTNEPPDVEPGTTPADKLAARDRQSTKPGDKPATDAPAAKVNDKAAGDAHKTGKPGRGH